MAGAAQPPRDTAGRASEGWFVRRIFKRLDSIHQNYDNRYQRIGQLRGFYLPDGVDEFRIVETCDNLQCAANEDRFTLSRPISVSQANRLSNPGNPDAQWIVEPEECTEVVRVTNLYEHDKLGDNERGGLKSVVVDHDVECRFDQGKLDAMQAIYPQLGLDTHKRYEISKGRWFPEHPRFDQSPSSTPLEDDAIRLARLARGDRRGIPMPGWEFSGLLSFLASFDHGVGGAIGFGASRSMAIEDDHLQFRLSGEAAIFNTSHTDNAPWSYSDDYWDTDHSSDRLNGLALRVVPEGRIYYADNFLQIRVLGPGATILFNDADASFLMEILTLGVGHRFDNGITGRLSAGFIGLGGARINSGGLEVTGGIYW